MKCKHCGKELSPRVLRVHENKCQEIQRRQNGEKADTTEKVNILDGNVSEVNKAIADIDDLERLKKLLELETEGNNRKTVVEPLEAKIEELREEDQSEGDK